MRIFMTLALILAIGPLQAQTVFKWVDEDGKIHYEHALPPDYADRAHERLYDGRVLERVDRAMTLEEREAAMAAIAAEQSDRSQDQSRESRDRLLLAAFSSEDDILRTRDSELSLIQNRARSVDATRENSLYHYHRLVARAAELERAGRPVPDGLAEDMQDAFAQVMDHHQDLERAQRRIRRTEASFEEDLRRYRELSERN